MAVAAAPLTLMAVHAHPDDESISTGGVLARYAAEGVRVVLVTCTDGGCGDGPGGVKPGEPGHDRAAVVEARRKELERSCEVLGVEHLELLGYRDSGMMGWPQNDEPGSFWAAPVEAAADRLAGLVRRYEPQVLVTYDANGFYGHPDHIQAHRITMAADRLTAVPAKVYWTAVPRSRLAEFGRRLRELGLVEPDPEAGPEAVGPGATGPGATGPEATGPGATGPEAAGPGATGPEAAGPGATGPEAVGPREEWGTPDEEVTTYVDVTAYADRKYDSLQCHASQADNIFFLRMGRDAFAEMLGHETFVRAVDRSGAPLPEDDLFAGLR